MSDFATFISQAPPVSRYVGSLLIREIPYALGNPLIGKGRLDCAFDVLSFPTLGRE